MNESTSILIRSSAQTYGVCAKERNMKAVDVIAKLQCENINVTTGIFSKVENGYNNPTVDMLIALTKVFECDFNEFFKK